jgi:hypothetical protein
MVKGSGERTSQPTALVLDNWMDTVMPVLPGAARRCVIEARMPVQSSGNPST